MNSLSTRSNSKQSLVNRTDLTQLRSSLSSKKAEEIRLVLSKR